VKFVNVPFTITGKVIVPLEDDMEIYEAENEVEGNDSMADTDYVIDVLADDATVITEEQARKEKRRVYNIFNLDLPKGLE